MASSELRSPSSRRCAVGTGRRRSAGARGRLEPGCRRLADFPRSRPVYAVRTGEGRVVATAATLPYGDRFAWISMVLVAGELPPPRAGDRADAPGMDELAREAACRCSTPRPTAAPSIAGSASRIPGAFSGCCAASGNAPPRPSSAGGRHHSRHRRRGLAGAVRLRRRGFRRRSRRNAGGLARAAACRRTRRRARGPHRGLRARPRRRAWPRRWARWSRRTRRSRPRFSRARSTASKGRCSSTSPTAKRRCAASSTRRGFTAAAIHAHAVWVVDALRRRGAHLRGGRAGVRVGLMALCIPGAAQRERSDWRQTRDRYERRIRSDQ